MISLQQFEAAIAAIREHEAQGERFAKAMEEFLDGHFVTIAGTGIIEQLVEVLALHFGPGADTFLGWWLWEPAAREEPVMRGEAGEPISVATAAEAYAYLCTLAA